MLLRPAIIHRMNHAVEYVWYQSTRSCRKRPPRQSPRRLSCPVPLICHMNFSVTAESELSRSIKRLLLTYVNIKINTNAITRGTQPSYLICDWLIGPPIVFVQLAQLCFSCWRFETSNILLFDVSKSNALTEFRSTSKRKFCGITCSSTFCGFWDCVFCILLPSFLLFQHFYYLLVPLFF